MHASKQLLSRDDGVKGACQVNSDPNTTRERRRFLAMKTLKDRVPLTATCITHLGTVLKNSAQSMDSTSAREVAILGEGAGLVMDVRDVGFKHMPEQQLTYLIL